MYSDSSSKSEILNKQFQLVFTKKSTTATPRLFGNKYPSIRNLSITLKGVQKLLEKINISKATGSDLISGRMLNMLAPELASIVHAIFTQSLETGELPRDWSLANVAPIFKKDNRVLAENYRPVSLTCMTCKLFEHIVCRHILDHVEDHKILTTLQHGFRSGRSCETQLINRNLKGCPKKLRDTAYISLIRPALEYSCSVWHAHKKSNKDKIEKFSAEQLDLFRTILGVKQVSQKCYTI